MFNLFNRAVDHHIKLPLPDDSIDFFESIKELSEKYLADTDINKAIYGFQIQKGSKWRPGLSESDIENFQQELRLEFPQALKNFYKTMNGLTMPGINVYGRDGTTHAFSPIYYSYPDDLKLIKDKIDWILDANNITRGQIEERAIPNIFPVTGHRFLIFDGNSQILSMHGDDIIFWADNISKLVATDIFEHIYNASDFESNPNDSKPIKFWLE